MLADGPNETIFEEKTPDNLNVDSTKFDINDAQHNSPEFTQSHILRSNDNKNKVNPSPFVQCKHGETR